MSTPAGRWDGFLQGGGLKESVFNNLVSQALGVCVRGAREVMAGLLLCCLLAAGCPVVDRSDNPSG